MTAAEDAEKVKVSVRVRPFSKRELDLKTKCVVDMSAAQTFLHHPAEEKEPKTFAFDHCFESCDPSASNFASQEHVFDTIGAGVVENAFGGYNACIFAYGQTGSGKSYTMMGSSENPGIIPRLCNAIFEKIDKETDDTTSFKVEVSYMEIYNEKVRDLLDPKNSSKRPLKVREHSILGPMVDGLSVLAVSSYDQIARLMDEGNKSRTVAATNMNAESSRSHAVFTIRLTQIMSDSENSFTGEKVAKISLVDLAGSERAQKTGAVGKRLEEGANINKSLTTLGMVISALAERIGKKERFVPYRDSVLTWLLKDNLGGNSKTVMIATISPAADNYEETLSTLRYADRAKKIVNHAVVNEDPNAKIIRELREEVETLRQQISQNQERQNEAEELRERLAESERLVEMMNKSWEERLRDTEQLSQARQKDLAEIGICVAESGIKVEQDRFYLVNLNADPSLNELLVYYINQRAVIGSAEQSEPEASEGKVDFVLQGLGVHSRHALLEVLEDDSGRPRLFISPLAEGARICVNGRQVEQRTALRNGYRLLVGNNHFFRVNCPRDALPPLAQQQQDTMSAAAMSASMTASTTFDEASFYDYDRAWLEANADGTDTNPISSAVDQYIEQIAIKHQEEKQAALEKQYEEFERYLHGLAQTLQTPSTPMTPATGMMTAMTQAGTPSCHFPPVSFPSMPRNADKSKFFKWAQRREELFKESLNRLKTEIVRANALAREANMIAEELWGQRRGLTHYDVTLQIPAANLRPSKIKAGNSVCEPVIVVKRNGMSGYQLWTMEQLENRLVDMREMYSDRMCARTSGSVACTSAYEEDSTPESSGLGSDTSSGAEEEETASHSLIDTLFESQEKHTLIGVANVFLEVLFHELRLDYQVPIISQQGEVCGKLHVEIYRLPEVPVESMADSSDSLDSGSSSGRTVNSSAFCESDVGNGFIGRTIRCRVRIKRASNLPSTLSHFVFCQYSFFNISEMLVVAPCVEEHAADQRNGKGGRNGARPPVAQRTPVTSFKFDHQKDFTVTVTEEFLEYVQEDALSVEVWGHRSAGFDADSPVEECASALDVAQKQKSLQERWAEVTRRLELWVDIRELNEHGEYSSVEVTNSSEVATGGVYQLKQGQQRRISVRVRSIPERGQLPLGFSDISSVAVGSMVVREDGERPLDSYQEADLDRIREQWSRALAERQRYLETQINTLSAAKSSSSGKSQAEMEREQSLINQWVSLTEERNAVSVPTPNSNIPGAPADWDPPLGIENHVPVVYLDLNAEELAAADDALMGYEEAPSSKLAGLNSALPFERFEQMVMLPVLEKDSVEMTATCSWDSSIHACTALNRPPTGNELVYGVIRVTVRLSHPFSVDLILRKRICLNVFKKPSLTERLMRRIVGSGTITGTGICYDVVAHVPKSSLDMEDRTSLAMMAARHTASVEEEAASAHAGSSASKSQSSYIEAYTKSIQAVEWMLKLDRLRQESAMYNMLSKQERAHRLSVYGTPSQSFRMKRAVSLPNTINNVALPPIPPRLSGQGVQPTQNGQSEVSAVTNRLMEMSTSASSGYASMVSSFVSPPTEQGNTKLTGIDEEQLYCESKEPVRSSTVPETLHSTTASGHFVSKMMPRLLDSDSSLSIEDTLNGNSLLSSPTDGSFSCTNRLFERSDDSLRRPANNNTLPPLPPRGQN